MGLLVVAIIVEPGAEAGLERMLSKLRSERVSVSMPSPSDHLPGIQYKMTLLTWFGRWITIYTCEADQ